MMRTALVMVVVLAALIALIGYFLYVAISDLTEESL